QAGPEQIYRGAGELRIRREKAPQLFARLGAGLGLFARKDEGRIVGTAKSRHANHALALGVVAGIVIVDQEFAGLRLAVLPIHEVPRVAEERRVLEKFRALLAAQPDVNLLQVTLAVVAGDAGESDAQETPTIQDRSLTLGIQLLHHVQIVAVIGLRFALQVLACDHVRRGGYVVALRG